MKLATFEVPAGQHVGVVEGDEIADLTAADRSVATMIDLLERGARETAAAPAGNSPPTCLSRLETSRFRAPSEPVRPGE